MRLTILSVLALSACASGYHVQRFPKQGFLIEESGPEDMARRCSEIMSAGAEMRWDVQVGRGNILACGNPMIGKAYVSVTAPRWVYLHQACRMAGNSEEACGENFKWR